jgi:hypothetical protein
MSCNKFCGVARVRWGQSRTLFSKRPRLLHAHHRITWQSTIQLRRHRGYKCTPHVIIPPRKRGCRACFNGLLKETQEEFISTYKEAHRFMIHLCLRIQIIFLPRRKRFGWNYVRLALFLGLFNSDNYVTVLSGSTQSCRKENSKTTDRKRKATLTKKILLGEWT